MGEKQINEAIQQRVEGICEILYNKKALDIIAIHVADKTIIADWFVICSGRAVSQVKALCDELDEKSLTLGLTLRRSEGYSEGKWIVLDYSDILVHIFYPEERKYYNMERLWDEGGGAIRYSEQKDAEAKTAVPATRKQAEEAVSMEEVELRGIVKRFAQSGWDLIAQPSKEYLDGADCREELVEAVRQADEECGSCGCEYDALYKRFLVITSEQ
ncbi:MAG: ribosome silencing factor [Clostridiaceae bacterium]